MAQRSADMREKIVKEGYMRHRQTNLALPRWRLRYVVFKITSSGRLRFVIYKEQPATPSNELKEIQMDEFGGLDVGLKDSEKHVFAVISTSVTDCFSTETAEEMFEWCRLLREYLGKELVLNIAIPYKQNVLRSGKAQLRIRNTGFTITTCDNPPRCMGTWQIIHIRKFGGTDAFRFQTGSKCPTGEFLYTLNTEDNARVKNVFSDLSQHKPIFTDDRIGRRMTVDRRTQSPEAPLPGGHHRVDTRYSLQSHTHEYENRASLHNPPREYENRQYITDTFVRNSADPVGISPPMGRRHSSVDGHASTPSHRTLEHFRSNGSSHSIEDLTNPNYQNIVHSPHQGSGRRSPQKRSSGGVIPEQVPEGYYNVSPPSVLRKKKSSFTSPPPPGTLSSPEEVEDSCVPQSSYFYRNMLPVGDEADDEYVQLAVAPVACTMVDTDNLVVVRDRERMSVNGYAHSPPPQAPPTHEPALYQNLQFMKPTDSNGVSTEADDQQRKSSCPSVGDSTHLYQYPHHASATDTPPVDSAPVLYTNVVLAHEAAHRGGTRSTRRGAQQRKRGGDGGQPPRIHSREAEKDHGNVSFSPSFDQPRKHATPLSPVKLPYRPATSPVIRQSQSNFELHADHEGRVSTTEKWRPSSPPSEDYYNHFVLGLPAHSAKSGQSLATTQVQRSPSQQFSPPGHTYNSVRSPSPASTTEVPSRVPLPVASGYQRLAYNNHSCPPPDHSQASVEGRRADSAVVHNSTDGGDGRLEVERAPNYDRLEIRPGSRSPCFSPLPSAGSSRVNSPRPACYDTLAPVDNQSHGQDHQSQSSSSSPEPSYNTPEAALHSKSIQYRKKVELTGHEHMYESVGLSKADKSSIKERPSSDGCQEHASKAMSPPLDANFIGKLSRGGLRAGGSWPSRKSTITHSRRKQLPLQSTDVEDLPVQNPEECKDESSAPVTSVESQPTRPLSQKRARRSGSSGVPTSPQKMPSSVRKDHLPSEQSANSDVVSSLESGDSKVFKRESTFSVDSTSSGDVDQPANTQTRERMNTPPSRSPSPPDRPTKGSRIMGVKVEEVRPVTNKGAGDQVDLGGVDMAPKLPPKRPPKRDSSKGSTSAEGSSPTVGVLTHPHSPPLLPRQRHMLGHHRSTSDPNAPPSLPPRPLSLQHAKSKAPAPPPHDPSTVYAIMNFASGHVGADNYAVVNHGPSATMPGRGGGSGKLRVKSEESSTIYTSIDHKLTSQFGKFKADVEAERREQREGQLKRK